MNGRFLKSKKRVFHFLTYQIIFYIVILNVEKIEAKLEWENCHDEKYVLTLPIILKDSAISHLDDLKGGKVGCVKERIHRRHAKNILENNGNYDEARELDEFPPEDSWAKLKRREICLLFCTYSINSFKATPFYRNKDVKILSLSEAFIEDLKNRYIGFDYDYVRCKARRITDNMEDDKEINVVVCRILHLVLNQPVRIGVVLSLTGILSQEGNAILNGIRYANASMPTIYGQKIEIHLEDDGGDPLSTFKAVNRLVEEKRICAIIGSVSTPTTRYGLDMAQRLRVPMIIPVATDPDLTEKREQAFVINTGSALEGKATANYAYHYLRARKAGVMVDTTYYVSRLLGDSFIKEFQRLEGSVEAKTYVQAGSTSFAQQISSMKEAKVDVLYAAIGTADSILLIKQAKELGLGVPLLFTSLVERSRFIKDTGPISEGATFAAHFHPRLISGKFAKIYEESFKKDTGKEVDEFTALGADAFFILLDAISRAKSTDSSLIQRALSDTRGFKGITGTISLGKDHTVIRDVPIVRVKEGKFEYATTIPTGTIEPPGKVEPTLEKLKQQTPGEIQQLPLEEIEEQPPGKIQQVPPKKTEQIPPGKPSPEVNHQFQ